MAIIAPSFIPKYNTTADMWGGISDIFGDITRMRESKRQIERQRIVDAQRAAAAASLERNRKQLYDERAAKMAEYEAQLAREKAERDRVNALRLSPKQFAREAVIAYADEPIPTIPSNFGPYRQRNREGLYGVGEPIRQPSPTMFGYKGPTDYDRYMSKQKIFGSLTPDEALTWKRVEDAISATAKREQDATKAFHQGQIDEVTFNKLSVQLSREKQALDQALNEAQHEINKKRDDAKSAESLAITRDISAKRAQQDRDWRGDFLATDPARQMVDTMVVPSEDWAQTKRFDPLLRPDKAKKHINEGFLRGFINEKEKDELLKHAGLADIASGKIGWPELDEKIKTSGYSRVQLNKELASFMKDIAGSSNDFTADEQVVSSEAILEALLQLQNINPQKDWLSEYRQIKADKTNFIRETGSRSWGTLGLKDVNWDPLTSEEITLTMLLKESKKRQDPQYENDKKRFKEKFGWLPKWA